MVGMAHGRFRLGHVEPRGYGARDGPSVVLGKVALSLVPPGFALDGKGAVPHAQDAPVEKLQRPGSDGAGIPGDPGVAFVRAVVRSVDERAVAQRGNAFGVGAFTDPARRPHHDFDMVFRRTHLEGHVVLG